MPTSEALRAVDFKAREAPNRRSRWGHFAGTDKQRAGASRCLQAAAV